MIKLHILINTALAADYPYSRGTFIITLLCALIVFLL